MSRLFAIFLNSKAPMPPKHLCTPPAKTIHAGGKFPESRQPGRAL